MSRSTRRTPDELAYGNTRLRARRGRLLVRADYERLLATSDEGLAAALAESAPYRRDVEEALPRARGAAVVVEAVRLHLGRELSAMRSFYAGAARDDVDLLLRRFDVANLRTVLRGHLHGAPADRVLGLLVPTGTLAGGVLAELAQAPDLGACIDRMVAWRVPSGPIAWALARAQERVRGGDGSALERVLDEANARAIDEALGDRPEDDLTRALRDDIDLRNVVTALRAWTARDRGATVPAADDAPLAGGRLSRAGFDASREAPSREEAARALVGQPLRAGWARAIVAWASDGAVAAVEETLTQLALGWALGRFSLGDPLGLSIPVAYAAAVECEAKNLRLVAAGVAGALDAADVRARLVVPAEHALGPSAAETREASWQAS